MAQAQANAPMNARVQGKIVQCIGAVVDVEFPRDKMPRVYDALKMEGTALTLEVQQQLGDGIVRTIALGSSDGLRRGMTVVNTKNPILVPIGPKTLGRIMDVLGRPIDEAGPIGSEKSASIHRMPSMPSISAPTVAFPAGSSPIPSASGSPGRPRARARPALPAANGATPGGPLGKGDAPNPGGGWAMSGPPAGSTSACATGSRPARRP